MSTQAESRDLNLPAWGPYSKIYGGVSHVPPDGEGARFDLTVVPGLYRRRVHVPNALWESGYHPWEASPDLHYYSHRHELIWKDRLFCDISFSKIDESSRLIRCDCRNDSDAPQQMLLHFLASLNFPPVRPRSSEAIVPARVDPADGAVWIDALEYEEFERARPTPQDTLTYDGMFRGEIRGHGFVGGSGLEGAFCSGPGNRLSYRITIPKDSTVQSAATEASRSEAPEVLRIRYRNEGKFASRLLLRGAVAAEVSLPPHEGFQFVDVEIGTVGAEGTLLTVESLGGGHAELDGILAGSRRAVAASRFILSEPATTPAEFVAASQNSYFLRYEASELYYGVTWGWEPSEVREILSSELDSLLPRTVHDHVNRVLTGDGAGHFADGFARPIILEPGTREVIYGLVCAGPRDEVIRRLADWKPDQTMWESVYRDRRAARVEFGSVPAGERYRFGQQLMGATVLTNVVYPVYLRGDWVKHNTPGRWWDCLYTWDSGFCGLGLAQLDVQRSRDCLEMYLTRPGDRHAAFIHHGTPLPVQVYLAMELWNQTQERDSLERLYPKLLQYHRFLAGRSGSSTTGRFKSGVLATWDYFYNSGGWDDYPAQKHVHEHELTAWVAPVVNSSHAIRTAKLLMLMARYLERGKDVMELQEDVVRLTEGLQRYAWDSEAGYFGYVTHNDAGEPVGILRTEEGINYNMGLDGASPLVAGACEPEQAASLIAKLKNPTRLWSKAGLSTVDQSAPYFRQDGYWNGSVWMPHQWFFWKSMLDLGEGGVALAIARNALEIWERETRRSYNCFEHFTTATERGAGWHAFGGLSTPVLHWFRAYFVPGTLTTGFDTMVVGRRFSENNTKLEARLMQMHVTALGTTKAPAEHPTGGSNPRDRLILVVMSPHHSYRALVNGTAGELEELHPGALQIKVPARQERVDIEIRPV